MSDKSYYSTECKWQDTTPGGVIIDTGNAYEFKTGDWRTTKPIWNSEKCKNCFLCWAFCPDMSIIVENEKIKGIDYDHCKGCGLCAAQCKFDAIQLVEE
ncbi:4Fe-4S binding protein [Clostridium sp. WLY-B-L2]|uniref:4Fe-4S binding protein n=1 Tax=Clostridium aromativorans TaxID=2836848 RepID=A0ABS8N1F1_9CLOT|nr:4Fe-4S binding protein [Clostridium aromativorans]MCC9293608.1 4Fe-4S binding protein [Clostridium aromativorans]